MYINPRDGKKRKRLGKFDPKTLTPKSIEAKTHWQKLLLLTMHGFRASVLVLNFFLTSKLICIP